MALETKKGGPYTKQQQEKRRKQVYELHFERGFSAVSIANELDVNRNTINEDIKYWMMQIASQFENQQLGIIMLKQIERLEVQRKRLHEQLEKAEFDSKLRIEKMISEMEYKILSYVSKIAEQRIHIESDEKKIDEISYEQASKNLKKIILSEIIINSEEITDDVILRETVSITGCDRKYAYQVFEVLEKMGMSMFLDDEDTDVYDLVSFGFAKGLLTLEEKKALEEKIKEYREKEEESKIS